MGISATVFEIGVGDEKSGTDGPFLIGAIGATQAASADDVRLLCAPRTQILAKMLAEYGEKPGPIGITNGGVLAELLLSPGGKTWTLILTWPGTHQSCLFAAGKDWQDKEGGDSL